MSKKSGAKPFNNRLPDHIGKAFEDQLSDLVRSLRRSEPNNFKVEYLERELFSKYLDNKATPADVRAERAITKWLDQERRNAITNSRLMLYERDSCWSFTRIGRFIDHTRKLIADVLGPLDHGILNKGAHTNGASTRVRRSAAAACTKYTGEAHVSMSAFPHWARTINGTILEAQRDPVLFSFVDGTVLQESSVVFTVPKKSDIDRVACKEPEVNMFLQRAVGNHIRQRLRRVAKVNLNDQSINQGLARSALAQGLATVDLSSASDSICHQLVLMLLPWEWYCLMDDLRVKSTILPDGTRHWFEMFSSMGNGFTFELESLLFYALTRVTAKLSKVKGRISVYGDDIICSNKLVPRLIRVFHWFGFRINEKKSNWRGPFRESCGGHYHNNHDVTPFYIREPIKTITGLIRALNQLYSWDSRGWGFFVTEEIADFHRRWSKHVPSILHGGVAVDRIDSLVTGDLPRSRVVWKKRRLNPPGLGRLRGWLNLAEQRSPARIFFKDAAEAASVLGQEGFDLAAYVEVKPTLRRYPTQQEPTVDTPYLIFG